MGFLNYYILFLVNYASRSSGMRYERLLVICEDGRIKNSKELDHILSTLLNKFLIYNLSESLQNGLFFITPEGKQEYERLKPMYWEELEKFTKD